ncbi:MAG: NAD(+) diphosphatase [Pseudobacteriovorax sp.]|nr:NAD(+) diphosphatase [Pseudobacteriovorax sp.]
MPHLQYSGLNLSRDVDFTTMDHLGDNGCSCVILHVKKDKILCDIDDENISLSLSSYNKDSIQGEILFLGALDDRYYFVEAGTDGVQKDTQKYMSIRAVTQQLSSFESALAAYAKGLLEWHETHRFCPACGSANTLQQFGALRICTNESCRKESYPRINPAVIMLVEAEVGDQTKVLLAHHRHYRKGHYSTLAGYLSLGESLEDAVRREVWEETRVRVSNVQYCGSQPWSFSGSIMILFTAKAETTAIEPDGVEVIDARWFSRNEIIERKLFSSPDSASGYLIKAWLEKDADDCEEALKVDPSKG